VITMRIPTSDPRDPRNRPRIERLVKHLATVGGWERATALARWRSDAGNHLLAALDAGVVVEGRSQSLRGGRPARVYGLTAGRTRPPDSGTCLHWYEVGWHGVPVPRPKSEAPYEPPAEPGDPWW
jgi:hypothetical protein